MTRATATLEPGARGDSWAGFAALAAALLAVFVAALDLTVVATILPEIIFDLGIPITRLNDASWIVTAYLLAYTISIPLLGHLSDRAGRWRVLLGALACFAAGSAICGVADSLGGLIAGRVVQAAGGGAMVPVTMALAADLLPVGRRAMAMGLVAAVDTAGWVAGPLYGAAVVRLTDAWQWVFWLNVPLAVLTGGVIVIAWRVRRVAAGRQAGGDSDAGGSTAPGRTDWQGAILLTAALLAINLGLATGSEVEAGVSTLDLTTSQTSPLTAYRWWLLAGGIGALAIFMVAEGRHKAPLVPIRLWRQPRFAAATVVNLLLGAALIVAMVNVPVFVNTLAPDLATARWQSALLLTPLTGGMALGALAGGWLAGWAGPRSVALTGLLSAALAFGRMGTWSPPVDLMPMAVPLLALGIGIGLVIAPAASVAVDSAGPSEYGVASALVLVLRLLGMAVSLSAMTAWALSQVTARLAALPPPVPGAAESNADFLSRLASELALRTVEIAARVIGETFWLAGGICLVALLPAWWLGSARSASQRH